jgi:transcriptional regulator, AsnC family
MDETDKNILNIIQTGFPVNAQPFKDLGRQIGISEDEALERIKKLKDNGVVRRIGAVFDTKKLGFASTLCAARVPKEKLEEFVEAVNSYSGVTHNYRRNHEYNTWFTFIAPTGEEIEGFLSEIIKKTGVEEIISMPVKRRFKINANFEL